MARLIQTIIVGLQMGGIYALIALGYTMVYGIVRLINFAHGDLIMAGGYALLFGVPVLERAGLPLWTAALVAMVVCVAIGVMAELFAYAPVRSGGRRMSSLIMAMGVSLVLQNGAQYLLKATRTLYGATVTTVLPVGRISFLIPGGRVSIPWSTILTIALSMATMVFLHLLVKRTHLGRAMRAVAQDKEAAELMGISSSRIIVATFALGSALAGVAATMWFSVYPGTSPVVGGTLGLFAFVAAVLGGIGSLPGAMVGGLLIGQIYSFTVSYVSSRMSETVVFITLVIILLVRPGGLMGSNMEEKV